MPDRDLYLAAYDVSDSRRLARALHAVRMYATGGQKSVHEIFLTAAEKAELLRDLAEILHHVEDRFFYYGLTRARSATRSALAHHRLTRPTFTWGDQ